MELKRLYHEKPLAEYRARKEAAVQSLASSVPEDVARQVVSRTFPKIAPEAVRGVVVRRADKGVQTLTKRFVDTGLLEGWLSMGQGRIVIQNLEGEDLIYEIVRTPGLYCCHCHEPQGSWREARKHVAAAHAGSASPDPQNPSGYRQENGYVCVRQGDTIENRTPEEKLERLMATRNAVFQRLGERYKPRLGSFEADLPFNIALGRAVELYNRVDVNDPANSALVVVAIVTTAGDATLRDLDTLAAVLGDANTAEATNTNYARKVLTDADLSTFSPDDANDRTDIDIPDQTWTGVAAGDNWTDLLVCYDGDTGGGTDANIIPISIHDFPVTPDGSDITAQVAAAGFYRAAAA